MHDYKNTKVAHFLAGCCYLWLFNHVYLWASKIVCPISEIT